VDDRVNVNVAVLDTGIDTTHPDLNVVGGYNCTSTNRSDYTDYNSHGTHVAGIIGVMDNTQAVVGVAPSAKLWSVRVFNAAGSGYTSWLICGLDWISQNAGTIQVGNYSGGQKGTSGTTCNSDSLHVAVCLVVNAGIPLVVAAGNDGKNASGTLPAAYPEVIAVGATVDADGKPGSTGPSTSYGRDDTRALFSNYGAVVTLYAPGVNVLSTWRGGGTATLSGTSMATPHVTGAAALYLADHQGITPAVLKQALINTGEAGSWGSQWNQPLVSVGNWDPPPAVHDVAATAVSAPGSVGLGATIPVNVTVKNTGNQPESISASLTDNGAAVGSTQTISLDPGASQDVTFNWTPGSAGNHTLQGSAAISSADATPGDNTNAITAAVSQAIQAYVQNVTLTAQRSTLVGSVSINSPAGGSRMPPSPSP
jgi:subtilisin family serine protease